MYAKRRLTRPGAKNSDFPYNGEVAGYARQERGG